MGTSDTQRGAAPRIRVAAFIIGGEMDTRLVEVKAERLLCHL
ncbi:MAG TPA: hypothetical protein VJA65_05215 [bacterium]|nr:hypothetical protein [bacterium]